MEMIISMVDNCLLSCTIAVASTEIEWKIETLNKCVAKPQRSSEPRAAAETCNNTRHIMSLAKCAAKPHWRSV